MATAPGATPAERVSQSPVVRALDLIISQALRDRAPQHDLSIFPDRLAHIVYISQDNVVSLVETGGDNTVRVRRTTGEEGIFSMDAIIEACGAMLKKVLTPGDSATGMPPTARA